MMSIQILNYDNLRVKLTQTFIMISMYLTQIIKSIIYNVGSYEFSWRIKIKPQAYQIVYSYNLQAQMCRTPHLE
jgi:hypothetical protein